MIELVDESGLPVRRACEIIGISADRYYRWHQRYRKNGLEGLVNRKSRPISCPHKILESERKAIIDYALRHLDLRHRKLCYAMQHDGVVFVSPSTVYRVLKAEGLVPSYDTPKREAADGKVEVGAPNEVWHIDITYIPVSEGHTYLITVLDGYSRYPVHHELSQTMTADDMQRVMSRALSKAGLFEVDEEQRPALISDNGTQLVAKSFQEFLNTWKIEHRRIAVRHPESNGKIEVFHKTIKHERIYIQETYQTFYEAKDDLDNFIRYYAEQRLHQGIGFVTPKDRYMGRDKEIIEQRQRNHQKALEKRKRQNRKRSQRHVA